MNKKLTAITLILFWTIFAIVPKQTKEKTMPTKFEKLKEDKNKKHFNNNEIRQLSPKQIEDLGISHIAVTSNFDKEMYFETFVAKDINPRFLASILDNLDIRYNNSDASDYIVAVKTDYKLYKFEP